MKRLWIPSALVLFGVLASGCTYYAGPYYDPYTGMVYSPGPYISIGKTPSWLKDHHDKDDDDDDEHEHHKERRREPPSPWQQFPGYYGQPVGAWGPGGVTYPGYPMPAAVYPGPVVGADYDCSGAVVEDCPTCQGEVVEGPVLPAPEGAWPSSGSCSSCGQAVGPAEGAKTPVPSGSSAPPPAGTVPAPAPPAETSWNSTSGGFLQPLRLPPIPAEQAQPIRPASHSSSQWVRTSTSSSR